MGRFRTIACAALIAAFGLPATAQLRPPVTHSFDVLAPFPPTLADMDGQPQLAYELYLTNFSSRPIMIDRIDALDPAGASIGGAEGETLASWIERIGAREATDARLVPPGTRVVVYLNLPLSSPAPAAVRHRMSFHFTEGDRTPVQLLAPALLVDRRPLPRLGPPLRGGPWAAVYAPQMARGHRRFPYATAGAVRVPGRFAIDWFGLDDEGRSGGGENARMDRYQGYGAEVLAVADGIVSAVRDDMVEAESVAAAPPVALGDATGNYVAIDIGGGRYAFYEHLRPGILVHPGQRVRRGQVIGRLGLTGQGSSPHLHFHLADANSPLGAEGLPFVIERFEALGSYPSIEAFARGGPWNPPRGAARSGPMLPGPNMVVRFPGLR